MVGRRDKHRVDVRAGEQFKEIVVSGAVPVLISLVNLLARRIEIFSGHVTESKDSGRIVAEKAAHDPAPLRTYADTTDPNSEARRGRSFFDQRRSRENGRKRTDRERGGEVIADETTTAKQ